MFIINYCLYGSKSAKKAQKYVCIKVVNDPYLLNQLCKISS